MANKPYKNYRNIYLNRKSGIHSYGWRLIIMNNKDCELLPYHYIYSNSIKKNNEAKVKYK